MWSDVWEATGGRILISGDFRYIWKLLTEICGVEDPSPADADLADKIRLRRAAAEGFFTSFPDRASLVAALDRMNLAWGQVRSGRALREQQTIEARSSLATVDDRAGGLRTVAQAPYRFSGAASGVRGVAPHRGEHNQAVLGEWLGMAAEEVAALTARGVLKADELASGTRASA